MRTTVALAFALGTLTGTALGAASATLNAVNKCSESVYVVYSTEISGEYESYSVTLGSTTKKITVQLAGEGNGQKSILQSVPYSLTIWQD